MIYQRLNDESSILNIRTIQPIYIPTEKMFSHSIRRKKKRNVF